MLSFHQRDIYFLFTNALDSHSMLSSRPSPLTALALNIWNVRFLSASRPRAWWTSVTDIAPSMSCLLASTTSIADFSSSSWKDARAINNKKQLGHENEPHALPRALRRVPVSKCPFCLCLLSRRHK